MTRRKLNTIFLFLVFPLFTFISIGYAAIQQQLTISGDLAYMYNSMKLYDVLKRAAEEGTYANEYTGAHQDSMAGVGSKKIYHWYGSNAANGTAIQDKFNVIFAGQCWQMLRTTDTGGVKLIYNGEAENNQCLNTRGNHVGYASRTTKTLDQSYYYGTSYTYDKTNAVFNLSGTVSTGEVKLGEYTCATTTQNGTCATLYLVDTLDSGSTYNVIPLNGSSHYSQLGEIYYNNPNKAPAHAGYMNNTTYSPSSLSPSTKNIYDSESVSGGTNYLYGTGVTWNGTDYILSSTSNSTWSSIYSSAAGLYTCLTEVESNCSTVFYITGGASTTMYGFKMSGGHLLNYYNTNLVLGTSYTESNGTYTLNNTTTISKADWFNNFETYRNGNYYICDNDAASCNVLNQITMTMTYSYNAIRSDNKFLYSNNFTYNSSTGTYTLSGNTLSIWDFTTTNLSNISTRHYTCLNQTGSCSTLAYVYYAGQYGALPYLYYINLTNGESVEDALDKMLYSDDVNKNNSTIKTAIDAWYNKYMINHTYAIEDTIFCNDRSTTSLGGWNPNGGSVNSNSAYINFKNYTNNNDLSCSNDTDRFSLANTKAQLTFPVGLMTSAEMNIMGNSNVRKTNKNYWLFSPYSYDDNSTNFKIISSDGGILSSVGLNGNKAGIRPAISLVPGTKYSSGNGSMANPYIVSDYISNTRFEDSAIENGVRNVTITFPSGCSNGLTCSYTKDNGNSVPVTTTSVVVPFTSAGHLSTVVTDGEATLNNSHIVKFNALYVSSGGNDTTGNGSIATPYKTLVKAYDMTDDTATIYIMNNITMDSIMTFDRNKNITLTSCTKENDSSCPFGSNNSIIRGSTMTESRLFTNSSGTLNLDKITINGNNVVSTAVMIYNEATLNVNTGSIIQKAKKSGSNGGAIYNTDNLTITGATISNNSANNSGGAIFNSGGNVTINSGTMKSNSVEVNGGGALYSNNNGTVTINGGTFESNTAKYGGALYNINATMTINGGNFYKNSCTSTGGVLHAYGTVNITGGTFGGSSANANTASSGGAIRIPNGDYGMGTVNMSGGTISYNTATVNNGGGVDNSGTFTMTAGSITNNTASNYAGGVYNGSGGTVSYNGTANVKSNTSVVMSNYNNYTVGTFKDQKGGYTITSQPTTTEYYVICKKDNTYVADVESGTGTAVNGTNVHLWKKGTSGTASRKWKIEPDTVENGVVYYHFENQATSDQTTKKVMDNASNSSTSGNNVQVYAWGNGNGERWSLVSGGSGYYAIKTYTGLCLDVAGGTMANSTNIRAYTCNNTESQRWKFSTS